MNKRLFFIMYNFALKSERISKAAVMIARWSQKLFVVNYILGGVYVALTDFNYLFKYITVPFITLCYNSFLRKKLNRPRPFTESDIESLTEHKENGSFPSNHAASAMVIAMAIWHINPIIGVFMVLMAIVTGCSRVMVGVHYPLDVLAGWIIGLTLGMLGLNIKR